MRLRSASADGQEFDVIKNATFKISEAIARMFLRWSDWWGDVAESIHTGVPRAEIRKDRAVAQTKGRR